MIDLSKLSGYMMAFFSHKKMLSGLLLIFLTVPGLQAFSLDQVDQSRDGRVTLSGKVTDHNGEPLPGATIQIKGSTRGSLPIWMGIMNFRIVP